MRAFALFAAALALSLAGCLSAEAPTGASAPPISAATPAAGGPIEAPTGRYALDPTHASVLWRLSHLGLSQYTGRFNRVRADLDLDAAAPERSSLSVVIEAGSVDTGYSQLGLERNFDADVAAALGAQAHPEIRFVSSKIEPTGPATGRLTGDLTLNGVTRPVTLDVTFYGAKTDPFVRKPRLGFAARGRIDRTQWGVDRWAAVGIGTEVELVIEAEFLRA